MSPEPLKPRVIEIEGSERVAPPRMTPQVIETERTDRIVAAPPPPPVPLPTPAATRGRSRVVSWGLTGLGVAFTGWLIVDAYWWVTAAFERSTALGTLAATAVVAGVAGAGAIIAREVASLWRLRDVETIREQFAADVVRPRDARKTIGDILAVVPKEHATQLAIESFQRQVQPHHSVVQQVEILSRTVMKPLDRQAEEHIRAAVLRAFGITAISPTALSDALFFLAVGVRMVRRIAAVYGHRPTTAATIHLLRRLVVEAGKLGAVDIAGTTIAQQLGGAVLERVGASAAESFYASYRMARLGVIVMDMCRPIPFGEDEAPKITSLVTNTIRQRGELKP
jgi:putative membrane protein